MFQWVSLKHGDSEFQKPISRTDSAMGLPRSAELEAAPSGGRASNSEDASPADSTPGWLVTMATERHHLGN